MTTLEHTVGTSIGKIPIGRRISEALQERGEAFSIRAFAERIGINRETFRTILKGERAITLPELERVVAGLRITEERLRQMDTFKKQEELEALLKANERTKVMMLRALTLANNLNEVAIGMTERCVSFANLGRAQFHLQKYDEAHESWLKASEFAEKVKEEYGDGTLLYHVFSFLLISFTTRREYSNIQHTLNVVENAFPNDPEKLGYVSYTRMKWHEHRGDLNKALEYANLALGYFHSTNNNSQIGKAMINVAHYQYQKGDFNEAKSMLSSSLGYLHSYDYAKLYAIKDYVKTLIRLGENDHAVQLIEQNKDLAKEYPDLNGRLQILHSMGVCQ